MVTILLGLRRTVVRHQLARGHSAGLLAAAVLAGLTALSTIWVGLVSYPSQAAATSVLALVYLLWVGGRVVTSALSGDPVLRPEIFGLLPLPRRRLAWSLLLVGLLDPAQLFVGVALAALVARAAGLGAGPILVSVLAAALTLILSSVAATVAGSVLGPGARRGHDTGTIVTAIAISVIAVAGTLLPALVTVLRQGRAPWLADTLRVLPSGWGPAAVEAAARGHWLTVALALAGLAVVTLAVAACWPAVLTRRMDASGQPARAARAHPTGRRLLPATPVGAVAAKETRLWLRDPIRLTCLLIAIIVGAAACAIPRFTVGTSALLPFAGIATAWIAGACACNLFGLDGTSLWLTVMTPGSARSDIRGRQAAWLLLLGPYTVVITVVFTALAGKAVYWPWALALLPAVLGGAAGLAPVSSLVSVQPLDETGNPGPGYSLKVHVALLVFAATAAAPAAVLLAAALTHTTWLAWLAVAIGIATGALLAASLGALATRRLETRQVAVLTLLANAAR
jgi:ABC-2 type transport system permease protein